MNKEQLEKKKEAFKKYIMNDTTKHEWDEFDFNNGFDAGVEVMQAEIDELNDKLKRVDCIGYECMYENENKTLKKLLQDCVRVMFSVDGLRKEYLKEKIELTLKENK